MTGGIPTAGHQIAQSGQALSPWPKPITPSRLLIPATVSVNPGASSGNGVNEVPRFHICSVGELSHATWPESLSALAEQNVNGPGAGIVCAVPVVPLGVVGVQRKELKSGNDLNAATAPFLFSPTTPPGSGFPGNAMVATSVNVYWTASAGAEAMSHATRRAAHAAILRLSDCFISCSR